MYVFRDGRGITQQDRAITRLEVEGGQRTVIHKVEAILKTSEDLLYEIKDILGNSIWRGNNYLTLACWTLNVRELSYITL